MHFRNTLGLLVLSTAACVGSSHATAAKVEACADANAPQKAMVACSALIRSGEVSGRELGFAHANRASAYSRTGDQDKAIADLDEALRLMPGDAHVRTAG